MMRAVYFKLVLVAVVAGHALGQLPSDDGRPPVWNEEIQHGQLAPELKDLHASLTAGDNIDIEDVKEAVDGLGKAPVAPFQQFAWANEFLPTAITKGIIDAASPNFKLPPGVTSAIAPGVAHFVKQTADGSDTGIPNTAKNHFSGVQRGAINAAVGSMRVLGNHGQLDQWGTRQSADHKKFPTYAGYLKNIMDNFHIGPGYGIGAVPATLMRSTSYINPAMPFGPGPLGSGMDFFGLTNAQRMSVSTKDGLNPVLPLNFDVTQFQLNNPSLPADQQSGFSIPASATQQFPKEVINAFPKSLEYAYSGLGQGPVSGLSPIFM